MRFRVTVQGKSYEVEVEPIDDASVAGSGHPGDSSGGGGGAELPCPIAGEVLEVLVKAGDEVTEGQPVVVIEALKVESNVVSPRDGTVSAVLVQADDRVVAGQALLRF